MDAIRTVQSAVVHTAEVKLRDAILLNTHLCIVEYLQADMAYLTHERVRVLYIDVKGRLIKNECLADGGLSSAEVPIRTVIGRALELGAANLVLSHNHPSGILKPSPSDERLTTDLERAAGLFDITLLAHFLVSREGYTVVGRRGLILL